MPSNLCPGDILQICFGFLVTHSQSKTITYDYEPAHKIVVLIAYAWVKVQNFPNPELLKFKF